MSFLGLCFGFTRRVDRRAYLGCGIALMMLKYAVDSLIFKVLGTGKMLNPIEYLHPSLTFRLSTLVPDAVTAEGGVYDPPVALFFATAIWALPFMWVGASMSVRRAIDAGLSKWTGFFFFLPVVNLLFIVVLCCLPSMELAERVQHSEETSDSTPLIASAFKAVGLTALLGLIATLLSVFGLGQYGAGLFIGTPFVMGVLAAYLVNQSENRGLRVSISVALLSVVICAGALLLTALEGGLCLVMASPIALVLSGLGGLLGHGMVKLYANAQTSLTALTCALPLLMVTHSVLPTNQEEHAVETIIEIEAPPEKVWPNVVGFSELPIPKDWLLKTGIAMPLRARIDGEGVGAIRYCEFTTGPFVEPITAWEYPHRLAFDVIKQPPSMKEWSPYQVVHAPHLVDGLVSKRGQFKLVRIGVNKTRLEGTTWYTINMRPQLYWSFWADGLIHAIHGRVLRHVKVLSEG